MDEEKPKKKRKKAAAEGEGGEPKVHKRDHEAGGVSDTPGGLFRGGVERGPVHGPMAADLRPRRE